MGSTSGFITAVALCIIAMALMDISASLEVIASPPPVELPEVK